MSGIKSHMSMILQILERARMIKKFIDSPEDSDESQDILLTCIETKGRDYLKLPELTEKECRIFDRWFDLVDESFWGWQNFRERQMEQNHHRTMSQISDRFFIAKMKAAGIFDEVPEKVSLESAEKIILHLRCGTGE